MKSLGANAIVIVGLYPKLLLVRMQIKLVWIVFERKINQKKKHVENFDSKIITAYLVLVQTLDFVGGKAAVNIFNK